MHRPHNLHVQVSVSQSVPCAHSSDMGMAVYLNFVFPICVMNLKQSQHKKLRNNSSHLVTLFSNQHACAVVIILEFQMILWRSVVCVNMENAGAQESCTLVLNLAGAAYKSDCNYKHNPGDSCHKYQYDMYIFLF